MKEQPTCDIKEELMSRSFDYFVENGLENTSLRDLCKGIGASSGSMYYWFTCKDDIVISTAQYALEKVSSEIFEYAYRDMHDFEKFFLSAADLIKESGNNKRMRFIYQVATSPVYGPRLRHKANVLHESYEFYAEKLAEFMGVSKESMKPIVYMFIATILDYAIWDDYEITVNQLKEIYKFYQIKIKEEREKQA